MIKEMNFKERVMFIAKGGIGTAIVLLMAVLSSTDNYYIVGLIPLFPSFGIIAQVIVYKEKGIEALKETILFGLFALVPYLIYLVTVYFFISITGFITSIVLGMVTWTVFALLLVKKWDKIGKFLQEESVLIHDKFKEEDRCYI